MRTYIAHNMNNSDELCTKLKSIQGELAATRKDVDEGVELLIKEEEEREVAEVKAHQMNEEKEAMEAKHKKVEQENEWLKQEMEELWAGFITQKGELEGEYKKKVDDMFSFGY